MIGQTISHYRIVEKLGGGGMGVVYEAEDLKLHRHVALKFLPDGVAVDSTAMRRFEREARAASALNHPNICTIHEVEEHNRQPVIVMELLQGESLKDRIRRGPIATNELFEWGIQSSEALEAAHAKGIVHRDIKRGNIFIVDGRRVKVLDFGLAKVIPSHLPENRLDDESLTMEGVIPGTTAYMSPEQVRGEETDARSDLFSLGVVLYEMATEKRPFVGKNRVLLMDAILNAQPAAPSRVNGALPASFDAIVGKLLEKDRERRYQHAGDLCSDLKRLKRETESGQAAVATAAPAQQGRKHRVGGWKLAVSAGVVVLAITAAAIFYSRRATSLSEKDTIVLADFDNKTGDPVFDDTLKQALAVDLEQSPFLNILSESKAAATLRLMGRPPERPVTGEVARDLCQRVGSKAMLAGSISALGNNYVIGLNAINCASGEVLVRQQVEAPGKEEVLKALGNAATEMRRKLGESLTSMQKFATPIEEATTSSLEALKAYSEGRRAFYRQGDVAAIPYYKHAVEADPNFAMAYSALAASYGNLGQATRASENARKAFALRERVSEREKYRISGRYYDDATGELDKAVQAYELWQQNYPNDAIATIDLGDLSMRLGQWEQALPPTEDGLRLEPSAIGYENKAQIQLALNRTADAKTTLDQAMSRKIDSHVLRLTRYLVAFLQGDEATMQQQLAWAAGRSGDEDWLLSTQSDAEAYFGRLGRAREYSQRAMESALRADARETAALWQVDAALREAEFGNASSARQNARAALALAEGRDISSVAALALARAGDTAQAQKLEEKLNQDFPQNTIVQGYWLPSVRAAMEISAKNAESALGMLQTTPPYQLAQSQPFQVGMLYPVYLRGQAYLLAHNGTAAATEFQKMLDHRGIVLNFVTGALAHLQIGRAYAMAGDTAKARAAYQDFLTLWKDADPDIPILKEAKAEYAKLE